MRAFFVYITTPDRATARSLAEVLVQERLCACANILDGMESVYWWEGKVQKAHEAVLVCKTSESRYAAFEQRARALHPYDTPCITALPIATGFAPFLQWIADETRS